MKLSSFLLLMMLPPSWLQAQNAVADTGGSVVWPREYLLEIHRPQVSGGDGKAYLSGVVQNLIADQLFLQRSAVTRGKLAPISIEYSLQADHTRLPENERENLLARFPKPAILPLRIQRLTRERELPADCRGLRDDRYTLLSRIQSAGTKVTLQVSLCQGSEVLQSQSGTADEQELVAAVTHLVNPVRAKLTGDTYSTIRIESDPPQASVYLDDQFLGKTPLDYSYLIPGNYRLVLKLDGHRGADEKIQPQAGDTFRKKIVLNPAPGGGVMEITTDPSGAKIYLDADYYGKTPKKLENIPLGTYRVHLLHPEKGEVYRSVTLSEKNKNLILHETLSEFLADRRPGLLGLSYKTWYWMSLTTSAAFLGAGIVFYVWRDEAQEQIFGRLSGKSPSQYTSEDQTFLAEQNAAITTRGDYATAFTVSAGLFAALSVYFYVQHLLSADEGIVMKQPKPAEDFEIRLGGMPGNTGVSAHYRF